MRVLASTRTCSATSNQGFQALILKLSELLDSTLYNQVFAYSLSSQTNPVTELLSKAIELDPEEYKKLAQTDSDFDSIRQTPAFQALLTDNPAS